MNLTDMTRWIKASTIKNLKERLKNCGVPIFVEGEDDLGSRNSKRIELRIDGPYTSPCGSAGEYKFYIEINILTVAGRDESNIYGHDNMKGAAAQSLNSDFCVYRTGNQTVAEADDNSFVGLMKLVVEDKIKTSDFGQIDTTTQLYAAATEAHFEMYTFLK
jgi:hypothetical protein